MLSELVTVHKYLDAAAQARLAYSKSWETMATALQEMLAGQTTTISAQISEFTRLLNDVGQVHRRLADQEARNAEDFRDIIERYDVMYRANNEYHDAKDKYEAAEKALESARAKNEAEKSKPDYEAKRKVKNENEIEKLKSQKAKYLDLVKEKLSKFIEEREKYVRFKVRRLCEGWTRYGHALKVESDNESLTYDKIQDCLQSMKANNSFTPENLQHIEKSLEEHIEAAPEPAPYPPVDQIQLPQEEENVTPTAPTTTTTSTNYDEPATTPAENQSNETPASNTTSNYDEPPTSTTNDDQITNPFETGSSSIEIPTKSPFDF